MNIYLYRAEREGVNKTSKMSIWLIILYKCNYNVLSIAFTLTGRRPIGRSSSKYANYVYLSSLSFSPPLIYAAAKMSGVEIDALFDVVKHAQTAIHIK